MKRFSTERRYTAARLSKGEPARLFLYIVAIASMQKVIRNHQYNLRLYLNMAPSDNSSYLTYDVNDNISLVLFDSTAKGMAELETLIRKTYRSAEDEKTFKDIMFRLKNTRIKERSSEAAKYHVHFLLYDKNPATQALPTIGKVSREKQEGNLVKTQAGFYFPQGTGNSYIFERFAVPTELYDSDRSGERTFVPGDKNFKDESEVLGIFERFLNSATTPRDSVPDTLGKITRLIKCGSIDKSSNINFRPEHPKMTLVSDPESITKIFSLEDDYLPGPYGEPITYDVDAVLLRSSSKKASNFAMAKEDDATIIFSLLPVEENYTLLKGSFKKDDGTYKHVDHLMYTGKPALGKLAKLTSTAMSEINDFIRTLTTDPSSYTDIMARLGGWEESGFDEFATELSKAYLTGRNR